MEKLEELEKEEEEGNEEDPSVVIHDGKQSFKLVERSR